MKKKLGFCFLLLISLVLLPVSAIGESQQLYKFIRNTDGSLGYDVSSPVPFYKGSSELVTIPDSYVQPKRQLKSSWVATISNLNIPRPTSEENFKEQYLNILNTYQEWNMNAMIFQVRPLLDAWYPSQLNPWSEFLSGKQGQNPGYDPLKWMIDETHKAGLEYHAWFNPYRVTNTKLTDKSILDKTGLTKEQMTALTIPEQIAALAKAGILAADNYAVKNPTFVSLFDQKLFLNPGIPEVQKYVIASIEEVVKNYDVDAIHFDDYFYPYRITVDGKNMFFGEQNEDQATFKTYGSGYTDIEEWRRDNISNLVQGIKTAIDAHNQASGSAVQFGISPFGIWEHKANDPRGSNTPTGSSQSYSGSIYADTYKWIKEETLDYVVPQIYWSFDQAAAPYGELTQWWNDVSNGSHTQVYVGHPNYKHVNNGGWDPSWLNPEEIPNQMKFNQNYPLVQGSVLFSYNDMIPSNLDSLDSTLKERHQAKNQSIELLKKDYFNLPSLVPEKPWLSQQAVNKPKPIEQLTENGKTTLRWQDDTANKTRFFILYKGVGTAEEVSQHPENIVKRIWKDANQTTFEYQETDLTKTTGEYFISAMDAAGVESNAVSLLTEPKIQGAPVTVSYQDEQKNLLAPDVTLEGFVSDPYTTESRTFEGYELVEQPVNYSGIFSETPQTVLYTYKKIDTENSSSSSSSSSNSSTENSSQTSSTTKNSTTNSQKNNVTKPGIFPSTGETTIPLLIILGSVLVLSTIYISSRKKKKV